MQSKPNQQQRVQYGRPRSGAVTERNVQIEIKPRMSHAQEKAAAKRSLRTELNEMGFQTPKRKRPDGTIIREKNGWVAAMLDPDENRGKKFPGGYHQRTSTFTLTKEASLPYFSSSENLEPPGSFNLVHRAALVKPLWTYGKETKTAGQGYHGFVDEQASYGLFPLIDGDVLIGQETGNMIIETGNKVNVKMPASIKGTNDQQEPYMFKLADGTTGYGQPFSGFTAASNKLVDFRVEVDGLGSQLADVIALEITDGVNVVATNASPPAAGSGVFTWTGININTLFKVATDVDIGCGTSRPGLAFRLLLTATVSQFQIKAIHFRLTATAYTAARHSSYSLEWPDQKTLNKEVTLQRTVAASTLLSYFGSDYNNGGQIASVSYLGGEHPYDMDFWKYQGIADAGAPKYRGFLKTGTYCIWKPKDINDMNMRKPTNVDDWDRPYMAIAGVVATPDIQNNLRLLAVQGFEVISKSQYLERTPSYGNQRQVDAALRILVDFPMAGPNESHLQSIREFLGRAWNTAKNGIEWVSDNKGWIIPAATAIASVL